MVSKNLYYFRQSKSDLVQSHVLIGMLNVTCE